MTGSRPAIALVFGLLALLFEGAAQAQDLSAGKTPEQLFRLNCMMCHKSPHGLGSGGSKAGGLFGLESFLAEHYTGSSQSAAAIATYLKSVDGAAPAPHRGGPHPHRNAATLQKPASKSATDKKADKKTEKPANTTDEKVAKPKSGASSMTAPKSHKKKPASHAGEAEREKPKAEK